MDIAVCKCGYRWSPRVDNPKSCPECKRRDWNALGLVKAGSPMVTVAEGLKRAKGKHVPPLERGMGSIVGGKEVAVKLRSPDSANYLHKENCDCASCEKERV